MKAMLLNGPGQPLVCVDHPDLPPPPGEATVRVHCAALNHRDVWIQKGDYHVLKYPVVPGADGAGVVTDVGEGVDTSLVGREVERLRGSWPEPAREVAAEVRREELGLPVHPVNVAAARAATGARVRVERAHVEQSS